MVKLKFTDPLSPPLSEFGIEVRHNEDKVEVYCTKGENNCTSWLLYEIVWRGLCLSIYCNYRMLEIQSRMAQLLRLQLSQKSFFI